MKPDRLPEIDADKIVCQQILEADHSVFSIQWVVIPFVSQRTLSPAGLLERYLHHIQHCTAGIILPL